MTKSEIKTRLQEALKEMPHEDSITLYSDNTYTISEEAKATGRYDEGFIGLHESELMHLDFSNQKTIDLITNPKEFASSIADTYSYLADIDGEYNFRTELSHDDNSVSANFYDETGMLVVSSQVFDNFGSSAAAGITVLDSLKQGIDELNAERQMTGLSNPVISQTITGEMNSPVVEDAGIQVISYDAKSSVNDILRKQQENIGVLVGDIVGCEENAGQSIYVGGEVKNNNGLAGTAILYSGFKNDSMSEIDTAVKSAIEQTLADAKINLADVKFDNTIYRPSESQIQTAKTMSPLDKTFDAALVPKTGEAKLDTSLVSESELSTDKQMGE